MGSQIDFNKNRFFKNNQGSGGGGGGGDLDHKTPFLIEVELSIKYFGIKT